MGPYRESWFNANRRLLPGFLLAVLVLGTSCASTQNTPQQDYTWAMWDQCKAQLTLTTVRVDRVEADGRYFSNKVPLYEIPSQWPEITRCMQEQFKAHPFLDWAKAQNQDVSESPLAVGSIAVPYSSDRYAVGAPAVVASAQSGPATTPVYVVGAPAVVTSAQSGAATAPVWQVGDEWQYAYKSPSDSGTYVWSVNRIESIDGIPHYVIKTGAREIFYRVSDLADSLDRVDGVVVLRETPSRLSFAWPLTVGKSWEQSHRQERPVDRTTIDRNSLYTVDAEETVTVPAGTFRTLKITWRNKNTNALFYEVWYAPDVKQWIKIREVLSSGIRERELIGFKLKQP